MKGQNSEGRYNNHKYYSVINVNRRCHILVFHDAKRVLLQTLFIQVHLKG